MPDNAKARPYTLAAQKLSNAGLRSTRQRLALAKLLFEGEFRHVTAEIIYEEVVQSGINVSLATVYNSLHHFTDVGLLREVMVDSGRTYFDTNMSDHHHYFMEDEGCLIDIPDGVVNVGLLPAVPAGKKFSRIEVIVHVAEDI